MRHNNPFAVYSAAYAADLISEIAGRRLSTDAAFPTAVNQRLLSVQEVASANAQRCDSDAMVSALRLSVAGRGTSINQKKVHWLHKAADAEADHFWTPIPAFIDMTLIQGDHANSVWPVTTLSRQLETGKAVIQGMQRLTNSCQPPFGYLTAEQSCDVRPDKPQAS